jgi:hypothetical protein
MMKLDLNVLVFGIADVEKSDRRASDFYHLA